MSIISVASYGREGESVLRVKHPPPPHTHASVLWMTVLTWCCFGRTIVFLDTCSFPPCLSNFLLVSSGDGGGEHGSAWNWTNKNEGQSRQHLSALHKLKKLDDDGFFFLFCHWCCFCGAYNTKTVVSPLWSASFVKKKKWKKNEKQFSTVVVGNRLRQTKVCIRDSQSSAV